ncbi:hypothetical protein TTHERM_001217244 (macronuclear) [Tetrahymena thermophila SB210]|uniref:Uncharacterized protein n=1 Tax=Tetrahymena thermophila (strain SB210) TaxID=312017 RepID=W7XG92_TETTS|nr:hypothetical protein TTHERM_001217244 [Tetrahymena thermophila SB210]EWS75943.1 hypothetical protein TTHERM_001217244 [Tetrahymena thermophila SB210]|eukprot:XP_012651527.1 hypothetical protein TTHERM_001217244 [Tetrahymena thermophila SB210]
MKRYHKKINLIFIIKSQYYYLKCILKNIVGIRDGQLVIFEKILVINQCPQLYTFQKLFILCILFNHPTLFFSNYNQQNFHKFLFNIQRIKQMIQQIKYYNKLQEFLNSQLQSHQVLHIDLSKNKIGDQDSQGLSSALANCTNLSNLKLYLSQIQFICLGL